MGLGSKRPLPSGLLDAGASIRGIRNLHAKLYLFGKSRAIITSANLTKAALTQNQKFGVVADDAAVKLSSQAIAWLGKRLQAAFDAHGRVPQNTLDQID